MLFFEKLGWPCFMLLFFPCLGFRSLFVVQLAFFTCWPMAAPLAGTVATGNQWGVEIVALIRPAFAKKSFGFQIGRFKQCVTFLSMLLQQKKRAKHKCVFSQNDPTSKNTYVFRWSGNENLEELVRVLCYDHGRNIKIRLCFPFIITSCPPNADVFKMCSFCDFLCFAILHQST